VEHHPIRPTEPCATGLYSFPLLPVFTAGTLLILSLIAVCSIRLLSSIKPTANRLTNIELIAFKELYSAAYISTATEEVVPCFDLLL
jgi:hypothetical protein